MSRPPPTMRSSLSRFGVAAPSRRLPLVTPAVRRLSVSSDAEDTPRKKLPLPRHPVVKAQLAAQKAAAAKGKKKAVKAPGYKKQTALFRNNLSSGTVSEDTSEV
ncbi:hypothetical protein K466DRAFT_571286, partial [Polyporus arcularius HHB13444]